MLGDQVGGAFSVQVLPFGDRPTRFSGFASTAAPPPEMDESQSLDALAKTLSALEGSPFDLALHAQHIRLTQSLEGMQEEVLSAMEMMTSFFAAGEDVWLALLHAKEETLDLDTVNGVEELLALYDRAENDYLCAPFDYV